MYSVKFVCGERRDSGDFDAVFPGRYFTAVNIRNTAADSVIVRTMIAPTAAAAISPPPVAGPTLVLRAFGALEVDCMEILRATKGPRFLKGFIVLASVTELDVVAVYTAGLGRDVASIDVETIWPRRPVACADLAILRFDRPVVTGTSTTVTLTVANIGAAAAPAFSVSVTDPGRSDAERTQSTNVGGLTAGGSISVSVTFPYPMSGGAYVAALWGMVDPRELVPECREDNNRASLGAP